MNANVHLKVTKYAASIISCKNVFISLAFFVLILVTDCLPARKNDYRSTIRQCILIEKVTSHKFDVIKYQTIDSSNKYKYLFLNHFKKKTSRGKVFFNIRRPYYTLKWGNQGIIIFNVGHPQKSCREKFNVSSGWMAIRNDTEYLRVNNINMILGSIDKEMKNHKKEILEKGGNEMCLAEPGLDSCDELDWDDQIRSMKNGKHK